MISKNKTFMEKTVEDISNNVKICKNSVIKCCKNSYQKMHFELTKTSLDNKSRYRNLNVDYSNVYNDDNEEEFDEKSTEYLYGLDNLKLYTGYHNIWFSFNKVRFFNNSEPHHNTINILKSRMGYCIISRSCTKYDIYAKFCYNLEGYRLTNKSKVKVGDIIFCRYDDWKYYCLGTIIRLRLVNGIDKLIDITFSCCPDSDLFLAWHFNNSIEQNKSLLRYKLPNNKLIDTGQDKYKPVLETIREEQPNIAAFFYDDNDSNEEENKVEENEIIGANKFNDNRESFASPFFLKKSSFNNEIVKFNTFWINENICSNKLFKRKQVIVSSREDVNNIFTDCLSNVKVISEFHMNNILNIHQKKHNSLKIIKTKKENIVMNMLEPQELSFFKRNKNFYRIVRALNNGLFCTYTGKLCNKAKEYLLTNCQ